MPLSRANWITSSRVMSCNFDRWSAVFRPKEPKTGVKAQIFFEKIETEAEKALKDVQIATLKASIERREKLLSNENYVKKAPQNIVELDRKKLEEEKKKLEELTR